MRVSDETYECAGCGGEVAVVEAVWLPEAAIPCFDTPTTGKPYCSRLCFERRQERRTTKPRVTDEEVEREALLAERAEKRGWPLTWQLRFAIDLRGARADNAALLSLAKQLADYGQHGVGQLTHIVAVAEGLSAKEHPGADLLAEVERLRADQEERS